MGDAAWDAFCDASPGAWVWHTSAGRRLNCTFVAGAQDLSFAVKKNGKLITLVPLIAEQEAGTEKKIFAAGGVPIVLPVFAPDVTGEARADIERFIDVQVESIANGQDIARGLFMCDPLTSCSEPETGFELLPLQTSILDLTKSETDLLAGMSKGYRSDIRFSQQSNYSVEVVDTPNPAAFSQFKDLYFAAAGRTVGTSERWEATARLLDGGKLVLLFAGNKERPRGSAMAVLKYKHAAYYLLSATLPEVREHCRGLGQFLQWKAIGYLKTEGVVHYELGWQEAHTLKEETIAAYKRHFGGALVPVWRGQRRYR